MSLITSTNNTIVKRIHALRSRKVREQTGLFWVEGLRIVTEAVQSAVPIDTLVIAPELLTSHHGQALVWQYQQTGHPYVEVTADVFRSVSGKDGPQGLGAIVHQQWATLPAPVRDGACWVALNAIQDPGNLGTILRTCDAAGAAGVLLVGHTTDPYDSHAVRASMGAIFSQRLVRTSFTEFVAWKRHSCYPVVGTAGDAVYDYREVVYARPVVLLMGSERLGLTPEQQALCDVVVRLPMVGRSDSLNVAVATGIMLYELMRTQF